MNRPANGRSPSCTPNRDRGRRYAEAGSTLVETLVALTVLAIGLIGVASLASTSSRMISLALERTDATLLAQQAIERRLVERSVRTVPDAAMDGRPYMVEVEERSTGGLVEITVAVRGRRVGSRQSIGTWRMPPP